MNGTDLRRGTSPDVPSVRAFDVVIIGGGPAGLSAGLWAARYRRRTAIIDAGEPRNAPAETAHGYYGWDGVPPAWLRAAAIADLGRHPALQLFEACRVTRVVRQHEDFLVRLEDGSALSARRLPPGMHLIQVAAATGAVAGIAAAQSLRGDHTVALSPPPAPAPESVVGG